MCVGRCTGGDNVHENEKDGYGDARELEGEGATSVSWVIRRVMPCSVKRLARVELDVASGAVVAP